MRHVAPAKINLCLDLGPLRTDGYHEVATVMQAVSLCDALYIQPSHSLKILNPGVPGDVDLVGRAARLFERTIGRRVPVRIEVRKRIPIGAGLGGGSSDAATTLRVLRAHFRPDLSQAELIAIGAELGSDVPFFLGDSPLALGTGRGERLTALPRRAERYAVLAWPAESLATGDVYRASQRGPGGAADAVMAGAEVARNDLMAAALRLSPACERLVSSATEHGVGLQVTGSGSAAFALFQDPIEARRALQKIRDLGFAKGAALCRTLGSWPWQGNPRGLDE